MQFTRYIKKQLLPLLYIFLVTLFVFIYFIIYRTQSRVAWYDEMHSQSEKLIGEFRKAIGIKS